MTKQERINHIKSKIDPKKIAYGHRYKSHMHATETVVDAGTLSDEDWFIAYYEKLWALQQN